MRLAKELLKDLGRIAGLLILLAAVSPPLRAQSAAPAENLIEKLSGLDQAPDIDVAALRQQVIERVKSKADAAPLRRPPIASQLLKLPRSSFDIQFDPDTPIIRPASYRTLGRIADALTSPGLLPYMFLVVAHTDSTGRREANLRLSQRRADAVRDVLSATFKISAKRMRSLGLGEEQLQDAARPTSAANLRVEIITIGRMPER